MTLRDWRRCLGTALLVLLVAVSLYAQEEEITIQVDVSASAPDDETWLEIRTANFRVVGNAGEGDIRKIAADLELFRNIFAQIFPSARKVSAAPVNVVAFRNGNAYRPFRPVDDGRTRDVTGYLQEGRDVHYIVLNSGEGIPRSVYRDYVQILLPEGTGQTPLWFHEGMADFLATIDISRYPLGSARNYELGNPLPEYDRLLRSRSFRFMPLTMLLTAGLESPEYLDPARRPAFLAQSFALVHFTVQGGLTPGANRGLLPMLLFFSDLAEGNDLETAFATAHRENLAAFESDFIDYVTEMRTGWSSLKAGLSLDRNQSRGVTLPPANPAAPAGGGVSALNYNMLASVLNPDVDLIQSPYSCDSIEFLRWAVTRESGFEEVVPENIGALPYFCEYERTDLPVGVVEVHFSYDQTLADVRELPVRSLSEGERHFHRGDILLHLGRIGEAQDYLGRAIERAPGFGPAYAAMGRLQALTGDYAAAHDSLLTATMLSPDDALGYYYRAAALLDEIGTGNREDAGVAAYLEAIRVLLVRSIELSPSFVEAAEMLARTNLIRGAELNESLALIFAAMGHSPGRHSLALTMAEIAAALDNEELTEWLANRVLRSGTAGPELKQSARALLMRLENGNGAGDRP